MNAAVPDDSDLPPIDPGLHLYTDVVMGVIASARPALRTRGRSGIS
ncbi:hypothetical protein [Nocardia sp. BMG51109]|nr:hypothetical protein [Nocardia sp. BMG51109]